MFRRTFVLAAICICSTVSFAAGVLEKLSDLNDMNTFMQKVRNLSNEELWQACQESADLFDASPKDAPLDIPIYLRELQTRKWLTRKKLLDVVEDQHATNTWRQIAGDLASKDSFMPFKSEDEIEQTYQVLFKTISSSDTPELLRSSLFMSCTHFLGQAYYSIFGLQKRNKDMPTRELNKLVQTTNNEAVFKRQNERVGSFIDLVLSASGKLLDDKTKAGICTEFIRQRGVNVPKRQEIEGFLRSVLKENTPTTRVEESGQQFIRKYLEQLESEGKTVVIDPNSVVLEMTKYAFGASDVDGNWILSYYDGINNKIVKTVPVKGIIQSINLGVLPIRGGELLIAYQSSEPNAVPKSWAYIKKMQKQKIYIPQQADFVVWPQVFKRVFISCKDKILSQEIVQIGMFSSKQSMLPLFTYDIARNKDVEDYVLNHFPIDIMPKQEGYHVWGLNKKHEKKIYLGEFKVQNQGMSGSEYEIKSK